MKVGAPIEIPTGGAKVQGDLILLKNSEGLVLFAYGSGSSRFSSRQRYVSDRLNEAGFSTLFMDLLTREEEALDLETREYRFNIPLLAERLVDAVHWARQDRELRDLKIGLFGGSTGASACLIAASKEGNKIAAVISRGGRTDLADDVLPRVTAATLFIVGSYDEDVLALNRVSFQKLRCAHKHLEIVPAATHLFEEPGKLDVVADLARDWFARYLMK